MKFVYLFRMITEPSTEIIKKFNIEDLQNRGRMIVWSIVAAFIVMLVVAMQFSRVTIQVQWNEAIAYSILLLAVGGAYELWQWLKTYSGMYRAAFCIGLLGLLLLGWVSGAVGIIGSEDNPANLMYWAVFGVCFIGSFISLFRPRGMTWVLFATAFVQLLVPVVALLIWPAQASWGGAGVVGVFILNAFFAAMFVASALLFHRAELGIPVNIRPGKR